MLYGEHTPHVEEVIDFAFSGGVLFATGPAEEADDAWITNDLRAAVVANAGDEAISRFRMALDVDVSDWGNTELLGHNLATGENLTVGDVEEDLSLSWHDLMENLVAELIWTSEWHKDRDQQRIHDLLYAKFIRSTFEKDLRRHLESILPPARPLEGWQNCAEHLANNMVSELWDSRREPGRQWLGGQFLGADVSALPARRLGVRLAWLLPPPRQVCGLPTCPTALWPQPLEQ